MYKVNDEVIWNGSIWQNVKGIVTHVYKRTVVFASVGIFAGRTFSVSTRDFRLSKIEK